MDTEDRKILASIKSTLDDHNSKVREEVQSSNEKFLEEVRGWYVDLSDEIKATNKRITDLETRAKPALDLFSDAAGARRIVVWSLAGLATVGGIALLFKQLFH